MTICPLHGVRYSKLYIAAMALIVAAHSGEQSVTISCQRPPVMYCWGQMSAVVAVLLTLLAPGELMFEHMYQNAYVNYERPL